mmetsp:Transcript_17790/g.30058  ORF Transcript_17790/g.30058 Transcript_17790/m.30058 type:complete len:85 (+) Transcript_17790:835-1089(+)
MAEMSGCLVVDEGSCGVAGVETEAVPGTIGRCAVEEMIDALVAWDCVLPSPSNSQKAAVSLAPPSPSDPPSLPVTSVSNALQPP